jgi:hypothetical protein
VDRGTVTVQPAGPAGKRDLFLTLDFKADGTSRRVEFVFSEKIARRLAQALEAGSIGLMQEFSLTVDEGGNGAGASLSHPRSLE